jgi:signal transduction histidine kinase
MQLDGVKQSSAPSAAITQDLVDLLFGSPVPILANLLITVVVVGALLYDRFFLLPVSFGVANGLVCAVRLVIWSAYRSRVRAPRDILVWARRATLYTACSGLLWGLLGTVANIVPTPVTELVIPIVIFGISASIASTHTSHLPAVRAFIYPACLLTGLGWVLQFDPLHLILGIVMAIFLLNLEGVARRAHDAVVHTLEARREIARKQEHLARAQRVAATGSAEWDFATGTEVWSDEMYRLWAVDPKSFVLTEDGILASIHQDDRATIAAVRALIRTGTQPVRGECRIIRPDGAIRRLYIEVEIQRDRDGGPVKALKTVKDITELRAAEEGQREAERRLAESEKLQAVGTLAGGLAHEINNALLPAITLTKLMARKQAEDSRDRRNLDLVLAGAERARDLVQQILVFSRNEPVTDREQIDLAALARNAVTAMRAALPPSIAIADDIGTVPPIQGNPAQIAELVRTLMTNAAEAIGDRIGTITLSLDRVDCAAGQSDLVRLAVADTGCGMDDATRARIFEPFFTTKPVGTGAGLGLSIAHGIIKSHGADIDVVSRPGGGTCFSVYFPCLAPEAVEVHDPAPQAVRENTVAH